MSNKRDELKELEIKRIVRTYDLVVEYIGHACKAIKGERPDRPEICLDNAKYWAEWLKKDAIDAEESHSRVMKKWVKTIKENTALKAEVARLKAKLGKLSKKR